MNTLWVADIGNTRIKWGEFDATGAIQRFFALPPEDPHVWESVWLRERIPVGRWILAGPHPLRRDRLARWLQGLGCSVGVLDHWSQLDLAVKLPHPERVGIDRLLNAKSANRFRSPQRAAVVIGLGTAVTIDLLDTEGAFVGGVIFPGLSLMTRALHEYTALLPLVGIDNPTPDLPGRSTVEAISAGVISAVVGGVRHVLQRYTDQGWPIDKVFLTGGDSDLLAPTLADLAEHRPYLTLEGIFTAQARAIG